MPGGSVDFAVNQCVRGGADSRPQQPRARDRRAAECHDARNVRSNAPSRPSMRAATRGASVPHAFIAATVAATSVPVSRSGMLGNAADQIRVHFPGGTRTLVMA